MSRNLGQMACCQLLLGNTAAAWALLDNHIWQDESHAYHALQQLGDAVCDKAKHDRAAAFALAVCLLQGIAERTERYDSTRALRLVFIDMLEMRLQWSLFRDILEEATAMFGKPFAPVARIFEAVLGYLQCGAKREDWLARQDPDLATTVRAILEESGLNEG